MKSLYCPKCDELVEADLVTKEETYEVKGENLSINAEVYVCKKCGEELFNEEIDSKNLTKLYDKYRRRVDPGEHIT